MYQLPAIGVNIMYCKRTTLKKFKNQNIGLLLIIESSFIGWWKFYLELSLKLCLLIVL